MEVEYVLKPSLVLPLHDHQVMTENVLLGQVHASSFELDVDRVWALPLINHHPHQLEHQTLFLSSKLHKLYRQWRNQSRQQPSLPWTRCRPTKGHHWRSDRWTLKGVQS